MTVTHANSDVFLETLKRGLRGARTPWWTGLNSALLVAGALVAVPAEAGTFGLSGSGLWSAPSTWSKGEVPGNSGTDLVQAQAAGSGSEVNLEALRVVIGTLQVSAPAAGGTGLLTLTGGEDLSAILSIGAVKVASGATVVFAEPLTVYASDLKLNADGGLGRIEFSGGLSDPLDEEFQPSLEGSVTVAGGVVAFKGTSTYTGATELQAGKLVVGGIDGLGYSSVLNLKGGTLTADSYLNPTDSSGRQVFTPVSVLGHAQIGEAGADTLTLSAQVDLGGAARTLTVEGTVDIAGEMVDGGTAGGKLVKAGEGKLILSSPNRHSGGTELQSGILLVTAGDALGATADGGPGGKFTVKGGTFQLGAEQNISDLEITGGSLVADPAADASLVGRLVVRGGSIHANVAGTATVGVVLADDPEGVRTALVKTGPGTLILSGENEYGGGTTLSAGTLIAGGSQALGTGGVLLNGGVLSTDGVARALTNEVVLSGTVQFGGSGALAFSGTFSLNSATAVLDTATDTVLSGQVKDGPAAPTGGGRLIKAGSATLTLSAENSYTGGTELRSGEIVAAASGALGSGTVTVSSGTLRVGTTTQTVSGLALKGGAITGDLGGRFVIQNQDNSFVQADVATSASISAAIGDAAGKAGVRKTGAGDLSLSGANTYRGDTRIEAGTVRIGSGDNGTSSSPLGAPGAGAVVLSGGALLVTGTGAGASVSLNKEVRVVSSGQLIAEGAALTISRLNVEQAGSARVSGDVTAKAVDIAGSLTLSGNEPLRVGTLSAGKGSTFVWDKPTLSGAQGIVITGSAATDLRGSKLQFSNAFVTKALADTGSLNSGGLYSGTLVVGNFVTSDGAVTAPSSVIQPEGIVRFKLVSRDAQKAIDLVLERQSLQQYLPRGNNSGFAQIADNLPQLFDALVDADPKSIPDLLKKADGGATFASVAAVAPAQALAVSASVDVHLDDLSAPGGGSSMSMGVRLGGPSTATVPMSAPAGGDYDRNLRVWTAGYGSWGRTEADAAGNGKSTSSGGGGTIGLERQMGDLMAGFVVSIGESVMRGDYPSYLRVKSDSWNLGGYGNMTIGAITLDASALWGTSEQDSQRRGVAGLEKARYSTQNWQTGIGVAANLAPKDSSWQISPVARLKYINSSEDGFTETGSALAVGSNGNNTSHVLSKLGLRLSKNGQLSSSVLFGLDAAAYWVHDYNSEGRDLQFTIAGNSYTSRTRDRQPDSAQFNLGMQATFSEMVMLRLSGQQDINEERRQTTGLFTVAYMF